MDVQTVVSLIGSLGFPIVCCIILFKSLDKDREENSRNREQDRAVYMGSVETLRDALHNNTLAMQQLVTMLQREEARNGERL